jgi:hypothetical protein
MVRVSNPSVDTRVFSPSGALPPFSLYTFNADTKDVILFFVTDHDYGLYSISEDKVHFFKLQMAIFSNNFLASGVTVTRYQPTLRR